MTCIGKVSEVACGTPRAVPRARAVSPPACPSNASTARFAVYGARLRRSLGVGHRTPTNAQTIGLRMVGGLVVVASARIVTDTSNITIAQHSPEPWSPAPWLSAMR
jgi:hypothetical protein